MYIDVSGGFGNSNGKEQSKDSKLMLVMVEEDQQKLLIGEIANLQKAIKQKEEKLRKLKMAEIYRKKV